MEQLIAKESHPSKLPMKHSTKVYYSFLVGGYFIAFRNKIFMISVRYHINLVLELDIYNRAVKSEKFKIFGVYCELM
ncbi:putative RNA-binding protein [Clostridium beijerinckii]|uniref:RNA-binding protein n=1 Tax=Clostridium beijerinckii TaxID=1520 RepID=A0AAX0AYB5_CLOBE|nr:putative RNA-binding protein [Clostridium beijerinckii]